MFCTKCGAQNDGSNAFCIQCGSPLQAVPQQQAPVQQGPYQQPPAQQPPVQQGGYYANTGATPTPQPNYYAPGYGAANQAPSMTMTARKPNYKLIGNISVAVVAVIVVAVILIFVVGGGNPLVGTWTSVDYGMEITFKSNGIVEAEGYLGYLDGTKYAVRGSTVTFPTKVMLSKKQNSKLVSSQELVILNWILTAIQNLSLRAVLIQDNELSSYLS
jgi:hypothetical protein